MEGISPTGIWSQEIANTSHCFDYYLAQWIGQYLPKHRQVTDYGCGRASYLRYLHDIGFKSLLGIEGEALTNFEFGKVEIHDLTEPVLLSPPGNVICLEVLEHIPEQYLDIFMDNIVAPLGKGDKLILSCAVPNQDGVGHVSCRSNIWVIGQMVKRGLSCLYDVSMQARGVVSNHTSWFRNTILIFEKQ